MTEDQDNNAIQQPVIPPAKSGGSGAVGAIALLLALSAAGASGYLWYQHEEDKKVRLSASAELDARLEKALQAVASQQDADLQSLKAALDQQQDKSQTLTGDTQTNKNNIETLQDEAQVLKGEFQSLQGAIQTLNSAIELQKGSLEIQKSEAQNLQGDVRNLQADIQTLHGELQGTKALLDVQKQTDQSQAAAVQALQGEAQALAGGLQTLQGTLNDMNTALTAQQTAGEERQATLLALQEETQALKSNAVTLAEQLSGQAKGQESSVADLNSRIDNLQVGLRGLLNTLEAVKTVAARGGDVNAFALSEVEYLLRMADHKLTLGQNVSDAVQALAVAQRRLSSVDENAFSAVGRMIGENLAALQAVDVPKIPELAGQVLALENMIDDLPLRIDVQMDNLKEQIQPPIVKGQDAAPDTEWWERFTTAAWGELKDIIVIRNERASGPPLIAVEEEYFLLQNLHLEMEAIRLALIQGNAESFQRSIDKAENWVRTYFDATQPPVIAFLDGLDSLQAVQLNPYVPDITATLRAFQDVMQRREPIRSVAAPAIAEEAAAVVPDAAPAPAPAPAAEPAAAPAPQGTPQ